MSETIFRQCERSDLKTVGQFVRQLYADDPGEFPVHPEIDLSFAEFERRPEKGRVVVFEQGSELIGYAILVFFWSNEFGGDIIEIDELLVDRACRGQGIGKRFFSWLDAEYRGCAGYALQTSEKNEVALRLYKNVGFVASKNHYLIKMRAQS